MQSIPSISMLARRYAMATLSNLINLIIVLLSFRPLRSVAVQGIQTNRGCQSHSSHSKAVFTHLYELPAFWLIPMACRPVSEDSKNSLSFSRKISNPCWLAAFVIRSIGPHKFSVYVT